MRKILLATTALVGFAAAAQAAESPISVNVGGYVDFRAAQFHESNATKPVSATTKQRNFDFETEYRINIDAQGKAANGVEYGGLVSLTNAAIYDASTGNGAAGGNSVKEDQANVWLSGGWGKLILGDDHGASDLAVVAPTVGEGQIDGTYTDFTDSSALAQFQPAYIDETENNTKVTYYTPKVGNENHKVQVGFSFTPNFYDQGQSVVQYNTTTGSAGAIASDVTETVAQYNGKFGAINAVAGANLVAGSRGVNSTSAANLKDFVAYGSGLNLGYNNFTAGGSYENAGSYAATKGQNKVQDVWTLGGKYEQDKVAVALNALDGRGYFNALKLPGGSASTNAYVRDFRAYGLGATYTWFPGLTSAFDAVSFDQKRGDITAKDQGEVVMVSQKITF